MNTMNAPDSVSASKKRLSIQFGASLSGLLLDGHCSGATVAGRLEVLAKRYLALIDVNGPTWPVSSWTNCIKAARKVDLSHPGAVYALAATCKADKLDAKLSYSFESMQPTQGAMVISVCERFLATGREPTEEAVGDFLRSVAVISD